MFILYYVLISGQKNVELPASKLRNKWAAHGRCTLEDKDVWVVILHFDEEETLFLWMRRQ